ncbi:VanW family protein [Lysinibacillus capsici]|uniref:VanW family protein n=1 Tax=Lysinibacillus capsici TaxID=2115968 RepID=A0A2X0Y2P4_9BACI|nr:VanW family protein [Lysinibacillus capsici]SPU00298.1 VanW family protein [Lysinibacillus capsici]
MKKKWLATCCVICMTGLVGCEKTAVPDNKLEQEIQQREEIQQPVTYEQEQMIDPIVEVVDPTTSKVFKTISPKEFGFDTDPQAYQKHIEQLAREWARGTDTSNGYDQRMMLDRLDENGQVIKGKPQIILKESELVERIIEASATGGQVEMPLYITESGYYFEDLPLLEEVVVASYTTYFNRADLGRNKNIELSARAIHNVIVGSGDYFSFNTIVGPRDEANGYQPAPEIINKKVVMGIGGGICQTSSTLFNAVDQIPVKYVERHHHSLDVGYVPKGRDATVSYDTLDFRFQNSNDVPFLIKASYGENSLTIEIRTAEKYVELLKKS